MPFYQRLVSKHGDIALWVRRPKANLLLEMVVESLRGIVFVYELYKLFFAFDRDDVVRLLFSLLKP
jgi:hypothetical protein